MNTFGNIFRISIFGESHGKNIGVTIDGCPAGIELSLSDFSTDLIRRKSGAKGTTKRDEKDIPNIVSGLYNGFTTGTPLTIIFENTDIRSADYNFQNTPRPGHADFTGTVKYFSYNDFRGGGHFSGRLTLALVAAGVVAKKILPPEISIRAKLEQAGGEKNVAHAIEKAIAENDSIGGIINCSAKGVPAGLGEPFFDSVESLVSHIIFSIPGVKGIEFGNGFESTKLSGSDNNDLFIDNEGRTATNNAGGISGGITNNNELYFNVAVKPTSSIGKLQKTFNFEQNKIDELLVQGRHDTCFAVRAVVVVESALAIVLADLFLQRKTQKR